MKSFYVSVAFLLSISAIYGTMTGIQKDLRSDTEWAKILTPEQFKILRKAGTEKPHSTPLDEEKRTGIYTCAACQLPLFDSDKKYNSHTGWPSFWQPISGHVETKTDWSLILPRTEYHCARCEGHQGHIFDDGPQPTGKRYCNNGIALQFIPADTPEKKPKK